MQTVSCDETTPARRGLPPWMLFAAVPLVLALGFISGIALSIYRPVQPVPTQTAGPGQTPTLPQVQPGTAPSASPGDQGGSPPTTGGLQGSTDGRQSSGTTTLPHAVDETPLPARIPGQNVPLENPAGSNNQPGNTYGRQEVRSLVDARAVLTTEFGAFRVDGQRLFTVDYQRARDIDYNVVLIGIVKISDYSNWVRATREYPHQLESWLRAAAERIRPAAMNEKFTLTWTIYETVSDPPYGFASKEVTPDPRGGGYVVTRPLAVVTNVAQTTIDIASGDSPASRAASTATPWTAYGPVIRFDPTDLYRPVKNTAKP